ncbi:beta-N-acetylhexosaminidase [Alteraurantiacibacter aquimixticola]|uniref:beta-N-acetylhexosaminidase n=1 Tax=Alteraurantiacibacter aquimixticola TaxID=2489173 RepID=A0A4T3F272_9SPHN|nr:beta-N-acetylhexosaminidase [Alteraurantiacibacter aquimixticola]TIX51335.1 beta-N-acetylhexosaminidase [Alteraurantiacibacter aquimixticola]
MTPAIFGIAGLSLSEEERAFFKEADPAGYILFGRNVENREQLRALTDELRSIHGRERLLISIDQEGGRVARMKPPVWDAYPPGWAFAELWQQAPASAIEAVRANSQLLGMDLAEVGISVDYTPLLDVREAGAHDVIGDRALGDEPKQVAALGRAVLDGLSRAGVTGCIKHMPGHGRASADSHKELPVVSASAEELERDIAPFRTLNDAPIAMSAHILFKAWDKDNPATLSKRIVKDIIRGEIGFSGLLLTDDIDMEALDGTIPERAEAAIAAGCDVVLNCWAKMDDQVGIAERLPAMGVEVAKRLEAALAYPKPQPADRAELLATRDGLLKIASAA